MALTAQSFNVVREWQISHMGFIILKTSRVVIAVGGMAIIALILPVLVGPQSVLGLQAGQTLAISVDDPRPLAKAVETLEQRYGWVITYEDPRYEHPAEIDDVTNAVRKDGNIAKKVLVPKGGIFYFTDDLPFGAVQPDNLVGLLERLLNAYNASGHPGQFSFAKTDRVFHVVPTANRIQNGQVLGQASVLDTRISLSGGERTGYEMIREVLRSVSQASGITLEIGATPLNLLLRVRFDGEVVGQTARNVLVQTFAASGRKLSWQLFYGPGTKMYFFNVHEVAGP